MSDDVKNAIKKLRDIREQQEPRGAEKRVHHRYRVNFSVHIRLSSGDLAKATAVNLSQGGIYIEYGAPADAGLEFEMLFDLPFDDAFRRVSVRAKVVRSVVIGGKDVYGIAFAFTGFGKNTDQLLEKYLELRQLKQH